MNWAATITRENKNFRKAITIINNGVRSLIRKELKIGPGEVRDKKINRPLAWEKEGFPKKRSVERLISISGAFHKK